MVSDQWLVESRRIEGTRSGRMEWRRIAEDKQRSQIMGLMIEGL